MICAKSDLLTMIRNDDLLTMSRNDDFTISNSDFICLTMIML